MQLIKSRSGSQVTRAWSTKPTAIRSLSKLLLLTDSQSHLSKTLPNGLYASMAGTNTSTPKMRPSIVACLDCPANAAWKSHRVVLFHTDGQFRKKAANGWETDSITGLMFFPFWRRKRVDYRRNDVLNSI